MEESPAIDPIPGASASATTGKKASGESSRSVVRLAPVYSSSSTTFSR
jgi:hypothetical protein